MARLTIKALVADLEASHVAYQALEAKYEAVVAERNALDTKVHDLIIKGADRAIAQSQERRAHAERTAAISSYREQLAAARALAMRTGRSVLVSRN